MMAQALRICVLSLIVCLWLMLEAGHGADPHFIAANARLLSARKLEVKGTTNLPDGAVLLIGVFSKEGRRVTTGWATARGGTFSTILEPTTISKDKAGKLISVPNPKASFNRTQIVNVSFGTYLHDQPQHVLREVGSLGENLSGSQVRRDGTQKYRYLIAEGIRIQ
jgi:hypothetical protein